MKVEWEEVVLETTITVIMIVGFIIGFSQGVMI